MDSPGRDEDSGAVAQRRLRAALGQALRRQDGVAVAVLRSALSAIGNAQAVAAAAPPCRGGHSRIRRSRGRRPAYPCR